MRRGVRKKRSSPVDAHVGSRIRLRRMNLGTSQQQLGTALGLAFQGVPADYFFGDVPVALAWKGTSRDAVGTDLPATQETHDLLRVYYAIPSPVRRAFLKIMQSDAEPTPGSAR
jgi:hypothetical protein